ncbi:MAG: putative aminohydrolase SsnA [Anaerolineae bacterium]|nr:putative aminohydrolase SsnA [Anaerolineae bacterium]
MIITNGKIITWGEDILEKKAILIRNGVITQIEDQTKLLDQFPEEDLLDAKSQFVMPGNICAHTHFYGIFSRGMAIPGCPPRDFPEILSNLWWKLDRALTPEDVKLSALVCIADAIQHGTTTLFDHHASFNCIENSLDILCEAVLNSGIRASLCYESSDRDGPNKSVEALKENARFIKRIMSGGTGDGRVSAMFGLHASLSLSEETLERAVGLNNGAAGFHIHAAEHAVDQDDSVMKYGERVIDRLLRHGILGQRSQVAHGVHIDAKEMAILADTKTWISHQPRSNMNNAVGMSDIHSMLRMGCRIVLGNDGFSNAMWDEWRTTYLAHKLWHLDPRWMNGMALKDIAIDGNAAFASQQFSADIGYLRPGAKADIIFVDYHPITPIHSGNLPWHVLFGFRDGMVTTTMVDGKILMQDRKLLTIDIKEINERTQELVPLVWHRYQTQFPH